MEQREYTLSVGLNDKDQRRQIVTTNDAKNMVAAAVGDCTIQVCEGVYTYTDGSQERETSLRVIVYDDAAAENRLVDACRQLKHHLNQECIVLSWRQCGETAFI